MTRRDPRVEEDEVSFEGVVDLGSLPPPASGPVDVHRAPTAVATMSETLMDEIRRAREEAKATETEKTRAVPKFKGVDEAGFTDEMPTRPGKDKDKDKDRDKARRPSAPDLHEALPSDPAVTREAPPSRPSGPEKVRDSRTPLPPLPPLHHPPMSFAETIPKGDRATPLATRRRRLWPRILFFVITVAALCVSALAVRRYRSRLHR